MAGGEGGHDDGHVHLRCCIVPSGHVSHTPTRSCLGQGRSPSRTVSTIPTCIRPTQSMSQHSQKHSRTRIQADPHLVADDDTVKCLYLLFLAPSLIWTGLLHNPSGCLDDTHTRNLPPTLKSNLIHMLWCRWQRALSGA